MFLREHSTVYYSLLKRTHEQRRRRKNSVSTVEFIPKTLEDSRGAMSQRLCYSPRAAAAVVTADIWRDGEHIGEVTETLANMKPTKAH
jgi:hypothetical protein